MAVLGSRHITIQTCTKLRGAGERGLHRLVLQSE